ncbi:putative fatty acyl-CoA reductase CG5065 [Dermacentor andersoni]|uniref:putative fatty acyl-CoA reductase CG5065 n=1 Tax=Dermacentor andersoni TaxID=34620 RepID=UPI0021555E56|nr:putative fatty acyl-CoA reductase CG5065 [Dermacentor andersoni]
MTDKFTNQQQNYIQAEVDEKNDDSQIARFYQDREVFITGGTGFIGKVLLEKLLRSCPGLKRVYLLVRNKRGEEPQARLEKMFNSPMFERLKQQQPNALGKVTALAGDLTEPNLGLSAPDEAALIDNVSIVFHSGATVRFDEPLRKAVELNVLGTRRVLNLCKRMSNFTALVHVSTAYCNCDKSDVLEVIYPPPLGAEKVVEAIESTDKDIMDNLEKHLFGQPNTYTLTKSLAESLFLEERGDMPVAIVRPSIVTASAREPVPGWIDNYNGCTGIIVTLGLGLLPSLLAEKKCVADVIPVDLVANMIICAGWHAAVTRPKNVKVYHCTSGALKNRTWADLAAATQRNVLRYPLPDAIRFPKFTTTNSQLWHEVNLWCMHYLPACIIDLALQLYGQKPRFVRRYRKVRKAMDTVQFFTTRGWMFRTDNVLELIRVLSPTDAKLFDFDVRTLAWGLYWKNYIIGIRKYLFKAEDFKQDEARKRLRRLYVLRLFFQVLLFLFAWRLLRTQAVWSLYSFARTVARRTCETLLVLLDMLPK